MRLGVIDFSEKHANIGTVVWATVHGVPQGICLSRTKRQSSSIVQSVICLKQARLTWWCMLKQSMEELSFQQIQSDASIYIYKKGKVYVIVYVDDAMFGGFNKMLVEKLKSTFIKCWECHDLSDALEFLKMRIYWDRSNCQIYLDQCGHLEKVIEHYRMINANPAWTPLPEGYQPIKNTDCELQMCFQQVIDSLLYIILRNHPDIMYTVIQLVKKSMNPSKEHLERALYIYRYLIRIHKYVLIFDSSDDAGLLACSDLDWGANEQISHS